MKPPRLATLVVLWLAMPTPAAACHRYSVWRYPWPQTCRTSLVMKRASPFVAPEDRSWYVEITRMPDLDDRAMGVEALRQMMKRQ